MAQILPVQVPGTWHIFVLGATVSIFNLTGSLEHPEVLCLDKGSAFILDCIAGAPTVGTGIKWPLLSSPGSSFLPSSLKPSLQVAPPSPTFHLNGLSIITQNASLK